MTDVRWSSRLAPALYALAGALLIWCAHSRSYVNEDVVKIPAYCGSFQSASYSRLLSSREMGEDGSYYRAAGNVVLGALAKVFGCQSDAPFRLAAGLIWLLCAASIVPPLRRAGVAPYPAWTAAALLMAHPSNSFCFITPVAACNMLIIPAAAGAWLAFYSAEGDSVSPWRVSSAAACVYLGCSARENGVLIPIGIAVAGFGFRYRFSKQRIIMLASCCAVVGGYLLQRHFVLEHDPPSHSPVMQWAMLQHIGAAYSKYLLIFLCGRFRIFGGMAASHVSGLHLVLWVTAVAGILLLSKSRRTTLTWFALFALCGGEIAASLMMNGEIMPSRPASSITLALAACAWLISRSESGDPARRGLAHRPWSLLGAAVGLFWLAQSGRHLLASRDEFSFLQIHSNPPYSWKIEGQRAAELLKRGDPERALAAAQASERMRPDWLASSLRASVEAINSRGRNIGELRALAASGMKESAAQIGYVNLGIAFGRDNDWSEAVDCFRRATELAPSYSSAWSQWAWAAANQKDWTQTAALAEKAIALDPDDVDSWQNLGYARFGLRDWSGAAIAYRKLNALAPQLPATRIYWARAEDKMGNPAKAWDILLSTPNLSSDPYAVAFLSLLGRRLNRQSPLNPDPQITAQLQTLFP
jgi:tetratricopeptide (TPR) repeat protein